LENVLFHHLNYPNPGSFFSAEVDD